MGKDTAYVTMLRDPIDVFESQWQFYGLQGHYGMTIGTIKTFKILQGLGFVQAVATERWPKKSERRP